MTKKDSMKRMTKAEKIAQSPITPMDIETAVEVDGMPGVWVDSPGAVRLVDEDGDEHVVRDSDFGGDE